VHPVLAIFRHNTWASERLLGFCEGRPEVAAPAEADVYGGIEPMFNHIVSGETGYLRLVTGEVPEDRVRESTPRPLPALRAPIQWLAERWVPALEAERDPEAVLSYQRGDDPEHMADWVPLVQCGHHGDDHRTQVATLLGRHGIEAPTLDGWAFGDEPSALSGEAREWWAALLRRYLGHHLWATERLLEHCRGLSPEQLALSATGTYGSIGATLDHLLSADRSYLSRLRGGKATPPLEAGGPAPLLEHLARQRREWLGYLDSAPDFEVMVERRGGESPAWVFVLQAINHGNEHRTHAGTVLLNHQLGEPEIDVWYYGLAEGALKLLR
jgi:uncharacterized damage-inducible protein DinB